MQIKTLYIVIFVLIATLCMGCGSHVPEDDIKAVQQTLAEADSLRGMGIIMGMPFRDTKNSCSVENHDRCRAANEDSLRLAETVAVLYPWRRVYADEYAKANYYYGRLLRAKDHYPEAMQCFIHAIHSRSKDYHILGRVYSNMGTISHLAGEYELSYEMYEHSADMFLRNGDTINYYYALNNMAFELAEQGKKEETVSLLNLIESECSDYGVTAKLIETKAELLKNLGMLDSAIIYSDHLLKIGYSSAVSDLIKAQSYSRMGVRDSAIFYAHIILADSCSPFQHRFNALYILSTNDTTLSREEIRAIASQREDIRYYEYEPIKELITVSIQLLKNDLTYRPNLYWLYAIIITLLIVGGAVILYIHIMKKHHKLLSQQLNDMEENNKAAIDRQEKLKQERKEYTKKIISSLEQKRKILVQSPSILAEISWSDYSSMCTMINNNFGLLASKLQKKYQLSEKEVRLCVLVLFDFSYEQMSELLYYSYKGIGKYKDRIAKKIGTSSKKLCEYLIEEAAGEH